MRNYELDAKQHMHALLELIMLKAISYSWPSVRGFYSHIAKQVELRRLEWDHIGEIREMAATYFKHSDLRSTASVLKPTSTRPPPANPQLLRKENKARAVSRGITRALALVIPLRIVTQLITCAGCVNLSIIQCYIVPNGKCRFPGINDSFRSVHVHVRFFTRILTRKRKRTRTRIWIHKLFLLFLPDTISTHLTP